MTTIEQVEADILSGKCTHIFYSAYTRWWTHLASDLDEATMMGRIAVKNKMKAMISSPDIPAEEKQRLTDLTTAFSGMSEGPPVDPTGSPCYMMDNPKMWIENAKKKTEFFGKHGLEALLIAHHRNTENGIFSDWTDYNNLIDKQNETTER